MGAWSEEVRNAGAEGGDAGEIVVVRPGRRIRQVVLRLVGRREEVAAHLAAQAPALVQIEAEPGAGDSDAGDRVAALEGVARAGPRLRAEVDGLAMDLRSTAAAEQIRLEVDPELGGEIKLAVERRHPRHRQTAPAELVVVAEFVADLAGRARPQV